MAKQPRWKIGNYHITEVVSAKIYVPDEMVAWLQENWDRPISARKARQKLADSYLHYGGALTFGDHQQTFVIDSHGGHYSLTTADPNPDPWSIEGDWVSMWPDEVYILIELAGGHSV